MYETRVSTLAICKLLQYSLTARDSRLAKITVRVEEGAMSGGNHGNPRTFTVCVCVCVCVCSLSFCFSPQQYSLAVRKL